MSSDSIKSLVWAIEFGLLVYVLVKFWRMWRTQRREMGYLSTGMSLPSVTALENGIDPSVYREVLSLPVLGNLLRVIAVKAKRRLIDEAVVIAAVEEDVFKRGAVFREVAAAAILVGLLCTFLTLFMELGTFNAEVLQAKYAQVVQLVGLNWPAVLVGLVATVCSAGVRKWNDRLFAACRWWLEERVFPELGMARGTADLLRGSLEQFNKTTGHLIATMAPLQQLGTVMRGFQTSMVEQMVPAVKEAFSNVTVGLSDSALQEFHAFTLESRRLLARIAADHAKMLELYEAAERRTAQIETATLRAVSSLDSIGDRTGELVDVLRLNCERSAELTAVLPATTQVAYDLLDAIGKIELATSRLIVGASELSGKAGPMTVALGEVKLAVEELKTTAASANEILRPALEIIPVFRSAVQVTSDRWQESVLQMAEMLEATIARAKKIEETSTSLSALLEGISSTVPRVAAELERHGATLGSLMEELPHLSDGFSQLRKDIVALSGQLGNNTSQMESVGKLTPQVVKAFEEFRVRGGRFTDSIQKSAHELDAIRKLLSEMAEKTVGGPRHHTGSDTSLFDFTSKGIASNIFAGSDAEAWKKNVKIPRLAEAPRVDGDAADAKKRESE